MALSLVQGTDTVDTGLRVKVNEAINAIPTGYAISNGILTITKFDTSSDQVTLPQQRDQVIDGGDYTQVNNLTFDIDAVTWLINNTTYNKATTTSITLGNGDVTNPRFDAIVLTTSNTVIALSGTAAASPVLPTISATQLLLMSVYIPANATSGTSDATVTYWGGYTANSMAPTDPLNLYKENYISGRTPNPDGDNSVAIGISSNATNTGSIAIGADALSSHIDSIAIGVNSLTTVDNQVVIQAQDISINSGAGQTAIEAANVAIGLGGGTPSAKLHIESANDILRVDGATKTGIMVITETEGSVLFNQSLLIKDQAGGFQAILAGDAIFSKEDDCTVGVGLVDPSTYNYRIVYYGNTQWLTAFNIQNSGASFGNLQLMPDGGNVGIGTSSPNANAVLDLTSTTKGLLLPRMTATQASAVTGVDGLMIYVTSTNGTFTSVGFWGYENGAWVKL